MIKRLSLLFSLVRGDARRLWVALRHPASPAWLKPAVAMLVLYAISPVDFVPDFIPFLGFADDVVLLPLAVRWILKRLPVEVTSGR
jgi:uncharacterized membrane protein YkvA (DUF1232 family)